MNKAELIQALAEARQLPPEVSRRIVETMIDLMKQQLLDGGRIEIRGFGSFEVREYKSYQGRNPKTGEKVMAKPKRLPFFKCGKELKDMVNER
ncbi:MAG: integration host factor subunit beta [Mailhella sp.]|nr:integration host factor subunit beta [Mailhella sp.]